MNEAVYRTAGGDPREETLFFCECGAERCSERIAMRLDEYESVRRSDERYLVAAGHGSARSSAVVSRCNRYDVVERLVS